MSARYTVIVIGRDRALEYVVFDSVSKAVVTRLAGEDTIRNEERARAEAERLNLAYERAMAP